MQNKSPWMSHFECVVLNYANFRGRTRLSEYWGFFLFNCLVAFGIRFVFGIVVVATKSPSLMALAHLYSLAIIVPFLAAGVRRMHDVGRSGWWILLPFVNLYFACCDSEPGDNKWGENPKGL